MALTPTVEFQIAGDGDTVFAGPLESDPGPDAVDVLAVDGTAEIYFENTAPTPDTKIPNGEAPWWAAGGVIGETVFYLPEGLPRTFEVKGTRSNSIHVALGTASLVIVTCGRRS